MARPPPATTLCTLCTELDILVPGKDIPWETEAGIPHQPSITALRDSAPSCALCYQLWLALGYSLANRGGMVTHANITGDDGQRQKVQIMRSNYALRGLFRAMGSGAMVSMAGRDLEPDFEPLLWVDPAALVTDPDEYGIYLFGNWWASPFAGEPDRFMLVGLGVRAGTSPEISDAIFNTADEWYLAGTYLRFRTLYGELVLQDSLEIQKGFDLHGS